MILVTAATAPVGRFIVEQLVARGVPVRALTRDPAKADLPAGAEVVAGDIGDPANLAPAFRGVEAVFLLAMVPGFSAAFLEEAKKAGVARIVFQSTGEVVDGVAEQPNDIASFHYDIERMIVESGLNRTFLRLDLSSADALHWAFDVPAQLASGDVVRGPYADAAGSPIHPADLAAIAVAGLLDDSHAGKVYEVTGPQSITHREQIELIGRVHGRRLTYEELPEEEARKVISPYAPGDLLFATWKKHVSEPAPVKNTIELITGRPAHTLEEWAAAHDA